LTGDDEMIDQIWGKVSEIIDDETFLLEVTGFGEFNLGYYEDQIKVNIDWLSSDGRIRGLPARSKDALRRKLLGRAVKCTVVDGARDVRLTCKVQLMEE
jgi:hypothetical protein